MYLTLNNQESGVSWMYFRVHKFFETKQAKRSRNAMIHTCQIGICGSLGSLLEVRSVLASIHSLQRPFPSEDYMDSPFVEFSSTVRNLKNLHSQSPPALDSIIVTETIECIERNNEESGASQTYLQVHNFFNN
jgi:hypothetical protein